jgi:signal transduction histidine kinase/ActR/RegA family two-component response regulator
MPPSFELLFRGGEMGALMRTRDWLETPFGLAETWPSSLRTTVRFMLDAGMPMWLCWGPDLRILYNDGYAEVLGARHPAALKQPFRDVWSAMPNDLVCAVQQAFCGEASILKNVAQDVLRSGRQEQTWFTISVTPIRDDVGAIVGTLGLCMETANPLPLERRHILDQEHLDGLSAQVDRLEAVERRNTFQLELAELLRPISTPENIVAAACALLGEYLGVSRVLFCEVDDTNGTFFIRSDWTCNGLVSIAGETRLLDDFGAANIAELRSGNVFANDDVAVDLRTAAHAEAYAKIDIRASLAIPLIQAGDFTSILNLHQIEPYHWTDEDIALAQDMAERTWSAAESARAQAELKAERDQSRYIFDSMEEGFAVLDIHWCVRQMNAVGLHIGRRTAAQTIGRNHWEVWPETVGTEIEALYWRVRASGNSESLEQYVQVSDDHAAWLEVRAHRALDGGLAVFFRDITQRKSIEVALRLNQIRADNALKIGQLGTFDWNIFDGRVQCSERTREIFGFATDQGFVEADYLDRILPDDFTRVQLETAAALAGDGHVNTEYRIELPNGKIRSVLSRSECQRSTDGTWERHIGVFSDVTDHRQFEQKLQSANIALDGARMAAEEANLAKSGFLSSMSHELRTPLNAVLGFAQLMAAGTPPPSAAQTKYIDQILRAGWYLLSLLNEILDLALIESGKMSLSLEPLSLPDLLSDCQTMMEPQAQRSGIRISYAHLDHLCFVHADRIRMKQVLVNLLSNAIKYNRVGGSVQVTYSERPAQRLRINVQDSGEGLSPEKLAQLFQPFNRLGQEDGIEQGTGIGLVVSKQLVELMEGEIGVQSTVGVGSVFWIELNMVAAPQFDAGPMESIALHPVRDQPGTAVRTVLYVEDNEANMMLVEQLVARRPDLHLLSARDAERGIALAQTHQPDAILLDINLPGINGFQALKILREDPVTQHIPVLALSADAMPRDIERGLAEGFFRYLTKPIKINAFMDALDLALEFSQTQGVRVNAGPIINR